MSWKNRFAVTVRYENLHTIEAFKIKEEPEALGKGRYRVRLVTQDSKEYILTTYESTIGNILDACVGDGFCTASLVDGYQSFSGVE